MRVRRLPPLAFCVCAVMASSPAAPATSEGSNPLTAALRSGWEPFAAHAGELVDIECMAPRGSRAMLPQVRSSVVYLRKGKSMMICQVTGEACTHNSCTEFNAGGQ